MNFGENVQGRGFRGRVVVNRAVTAELNGGRVWNNVFRVFLLPFLLLTPVSHTTPFVRFASGRAL